MFSCDNVVTGPADEQQPVLTDAQAVAADKDALEIGCAEEDSINSITQDLSLPESGANGSTVSWESSNTAVVSITGDGNASFTGAVTRPPFTASEDAYFNIQAIITKGGAMESKNFWVTVIREELDITSVPYRTLVPVTGGLFSQAEVSMGMITKSFDHAVSDFRIGKYEITYRLWKDVLTWAQRNGYAYAPSGTYGKEGSNGSLNALSATDSQPVIGVSWFHTVVWCNAYSELMGYAPVYYEDAALSIPVKELYYSGTVYHDRAADGFRLPSEGEWSYAAAYIDDASMNDFLNAPGSAEAAGLNEATYATGWFGGNSAEQTHPVGEKNPNALGLYDMGGNVREWCWDYYASYPDTAQTDYQGPTEAQEKRVIHGGSWYYSASGGAIGTRDAEYPGTTSKAGSGYDAPDVYDIGFRVARNAE